MTIKRNKIKVLTIGSSQEVKGGITTVIEQFLNCQWDNIDMSFLPTYIEGGKVRQIFFFCIAILKFLIILILNRPNIVHIHMSYNGSFYRKFMMVKLSKIFKVKTILHLHGSEFKIFYEKSSLTVKNKIKCLFETVEQTIVLGQGWLEFVQDIAPEANIIVCNNAVDIPIEVASLSEGTFNILFLAVLLKRKGIHDLIEVIRQLKDEDFFYQKNIKFIVAGDGPEYQTLLQCIQEYGLEPLIDVIGWVDNDKKHELLKISQLLVLPSYNEGLPMAILEAMSYGIPIISTDVGSIAEVVIQNRTGCLIQPGNIDQLKMSIMDIVTDRLLWKNLSMNARILIADNYNKEKYLSRFQTIYTQLNSK